MVLLACGISGCSYGYRFEISGIIRMMEGEPLSGVQIVLDTGGATSTNWPDLRSDPDGRFAFEYLAFSRCFAGGRLPTWTLQLSKEGYVTERVDISPKQPPASPKEKNHIVVVVQMRRVVPAP